MSTRIFWRSLTAAALIAVFPVSSTVSAFAETAAVPGNAAADAASGNAADQATLPDPPGRVGRLSYMEGTVSFHAADQDQWSPATLNFPVTTGDAFWTEPNSRAEIEAGAVELRMDQTTAIGFARLDDQGTQIEIDQGAVNLHMATMPEGGVQVFTAHGDVTLTEPGWYHIDAGTMTGDTPAAAVQITVFEGEARVDAPSGTRVIEAGESVIASGDPVNFAPTTAEADAFDNWARSRAPGAVAATGGAANGAANVAPAAGTNITWNSPPVTPSPSLQYVSPEVTGYQDLDTYGSWTTVADYGPVWYPTRVPVGWAPYRYGHWAYVAPWGWTWIDDQPWGFAPFHYGRWVRVHDRWGWCPGDYVRRPVYAPALVAFIGGDDWGISISLGRSFPAVGWVPLAPHEAFRPYYHASERYAREVNVTNVKIVNNVTVVNNYATAGTFANGAAATVVPAESFRNSAPVERARVSLPRGELDRARIRGNLRDLGPSRAARSGAAIAAAADRFVPKPGAEAKVITAKGNAAGAELADFAAPKAPGPRFDPAARMRSLHERDVNNPGDRMTNRPGPATIMPAAGTARTKTSAIAPARSSAPAAKAARNAARESGVLAQPQATPAPAAAPGPPIHRGNINRTARSRFAPEPAAPRAAAKVETSKPTIAKGAAGPYGVRAAPGPAILRGNIRSEARTAPPEPPAVGASRAKVEPPQPEATAPAKTAPGPAIVAKPVTTRNARTDSARQVRSRFTAPQAATRFTTRQATPKPAAVKPVNSAAAARVQPPAPRPQEKTVTTPEPATVRTAPAAPQPREAQVRRTVTPSVALPTAAPAARIQPKVRSVQRAPAPVRQRTVRTAPRGMTPAARSETPAPRSATRVTRSVAPAPRTATRSPTVSRAPQQVQRAPAVSRAPQQVQRRTGARNDARAAASQRATKPTENAQRPSRGSGPQQDKGDRQSRDLD